MFRYYLPLRGLSHKIDLAFDGMYMVSSIGLNSGRSHFLNFLAPQTDFNNAKSVFLANNESLRWFNNVVGVYLVQVSLLLIGQHLSRVWYISSSLPQPQEGKKDHSASRWGQFFCVVAGAHHFAGTGSALKAWTAFG